MVTAHGREEVEKDSQQDSGLLDGFLVKPITASMLFDSVKDAMSNGQEEKSTRIKETQRLQGLHLLVVEDNLLNQEVAKELLMAHGAEVVIASGGIEGKMRALDARVSFDAILMDMQMPDIDGLEATRQIRQHNHMLSVPIIAMTANALQSDKDACLAAGMIDHISKPVELEGMIATILLHTEQKTTKTFSPALKSEESSAVLDVELAIKRLNGDRYLYAKLVDVFRTDSWAQYHLFRQGLQQNELKVAVDSLHTLKGLAGTMGALVLEQVSTQIEAEFKQAMDSSAKQEISFTWIDDIEGSLTQAMEQFEHLYPSLCANKE
jgi:CheY-like chemotaxis protein